MTSGKLTDAQRRALRNIADEPGFSPHWPKGYARASWVRCVERLCARGLARQYVHGGYEITDAGRVALVAVESAEENEL